MPDKKNVITAILGPDAKNVGVRPDMESEGVDGEIQMLAQDLIEAVHARNSRQVADCLRAAFQCLDSQPHEEGPHESEDGE